MIGGFEVTDLHAHIQPWRWHTQGARETMAASSSSADSRLLSTLQEDPRALLALMDRWGVGRMALVNYVSPDVIGFPPEVNDWVAKYCAADPKRLLGVGSVHARLAGSAGNAYRAVEGLVSSGIRMLKIHPAHQIVWPDAYRADSRGAHGHPPDDRPYGNALQGIYEAAVDHDVPVMVHTGTSMFPGAYNAMTDPLILDTVAVDYPKLRLVAAHAGRPLWGAAAVFVARRHANVMLDLSGIPPKRLLHHLPELARIADKCLWGSDWPGPGVPAEAPRRNVEEFLAADLGLDGEAKRGILNGNSRKLLP